MGKTQVDLAAIIDLHSFLERDRHLPAQQRSNRDRAIGKTLGDATSDNVLQRIGLWWSQMQPIEPSMGRRVVQVRRGMVMLVTALGFVIGMSATSLALTYTGGYPINLLALIGVLVLLPGLFLLLSLLSFVCRGLGVEALARRLAGFNLSGWLMGSWDRLSGGVLALGRNRGAQRLGYWQVMVILQWFGVSFYAGVILLFALMVAFTDLAFGWSTTLSFKAEVVHNWVVFLALPWSAFWPAWVPAQELVEVSQYYRLASGAELGQAAMLGAWWPFVMLTFIFWGLLPRLVMLIFSRWRLQQSLPAYLLADTEVTLLLERLATPVLTTDSDTLAEQTVVPPSTSGAIPSIELSAESQMVIWNDAIEARQAPPNLRGVFMVRAWQGPDAQTQVLAQLSQVKTALVVKGWEPPLYECLDFIAALRRHIGPEPTLLVMPVPLAGASLSSTEIAVWHESLASLGDAKLVLADAQGVSS